MDLSCYSLWANFPLPSLYVIYMHRGDFKDMSTAQVMFLAFDILNSAVHAVGHGFPVCYSSNIFRAFLVASADIVHLWLRRLIFKDYSLLQTTLEFSLLFVLYMFAGAWVWLLAAAAVYAPAIRRLPGCIGTTQTTAVTAAVILIIFIIYAEVHEHDGHYTTYNPIVAPGSHADVRHMVGDIIYQMVKTTIFYQTLGTSSRPSVQKAAKHPSEVSLEAWLGQQLKTPLSSRWSNLGSLIAVTEMSRLAPKRID